MSSPTCPVPRLHLNTKTTNRKSLAVESSTFPSPDSANSVGSRSDAVATLAQKRAELKSANTNAVHRASAPALASSTAERGGWAGVCSLGQGAERSNSPTQDISVEPSPAFRSPNHDGGASLDGLSSAIWRQLGKHGEYAAPALVPNVVDGAKLNDLYSGGNVPQLNGPEKFRRSSKGHTRQQRQLPYRRQQ